MNKIGSKHDKEQNLLKASYNHVWTKSSEARTNAQFKHLCQILRKKKVENLYSKTHVFTCDIDRLGKAIIIIFFFIFCDHGMS